MFRSRRWALTLPVVLLGVMVLLGGLSGGCNRYNRLAKSRVVAERDSAAFYFYRKQKYDAASLLFEDLLTAYRGTPRASTITYYYASTLFQNGMYLTAANFFQQYVDQFPNGEFAEESLLSVARAYDQMSLDWEKDQKETMRAIEQYELFRSVYPNSKLVTEANDRLAALRERLARKAFEAAQLYYNIGQYRAAVVTAKNVLNDHPASSFREEAQYLLFASEVQYARNSIIDRQLARYREAAIYYERFLARFPNSERIREAERLYRDVAEAIDQLERNAPPADSTSLLEP